LRETVIGPCSRPVRNGKDRAGNGAVERGATAVERHERRHSRRRFPFAVNAPLTAPTACFAIARRKEEMGMDMDEIRMILAVRALRKLLNKGERGDGDELVTTYRALSEAIVENKPMTRKNHARVAEYLREAGAAA
jgi:hypothetical protein